MVEDVPDMLKLTREYVSRFGSAGVFNDFAQDEEEILVVLKRTLERGSPATDEEVAWLNRNVRADALY